MTFFNEEQTSVGQDFEMGGGDIEPIPAKTRLKAMVDEVKWDEWEGERYINVRWNVLSPDEYKGRKVFQKLKVFDEKKGDKAKKMLAAIDANAGGTIVKVHGEPTDNDLMASLLNKPMLIQLMVWEINDKKGNWVNAVSSDRLTAEPAEYTADEVPF